MEIIPRSNKACLKTAIDVDTNIVFEYAPNSENLSSDIFKVIDNRVIVGTKKLLVYELRGGFDQYAPSISVDFEGEYAPDYFTVSGDMRLKLRVTENLVKSYEVDCIGDPTNEGDISVSDILFAADTALSGESDILCDMDENGKVKVTVTYKYVSTDMYVTIETTEE